MEKDWKFWVTCVMVAAIVGGSIYFYFFLPMPPDRIGPVKDQLAKNDAQSKAGAPPAVVDTKRKPAELSETKGVVRAATPAKAPVPPLKPPPPTLEKKPIIATNADPIPVSASTLHRRLRTDLDGARREFDRKLLDLRGAFMRTVATREGLQVILAGRDKSETAWTVSPDSLAAKFAQIAPGQYVTLRGVHESPARMHDVEIRSVRSMGDEAYAGIQIELAGHIDRIGSVPGQELTSLRFEQEFTDGLVSVECWFKKQQGEQLAGLAAGRFVMVRGKCGGLSFDTVRLHNCEILYDYTPQRDVPRLAVGRFLLEYEQDLRDHDRPFAEEAMTVTATELLESIKTPMLASKRFVGQWLDVEGSIEASDTAKRAIILEGGTDQALKITCLFSAARFRTLKTASRMIVRGFCAGVEGKSVRLDNCETLLPAAAPEKAGPRLDVQYFPFRNGERLHYDTAYLVGPNAKSALRHALVFKELRFMETTPTQSGELKRPGVLSGGVNWTKKFSATKPLVQQYRLHAGRIEVNADAEGGAADAWEPLLVIGAQAGDRWQWTHRGQRANYELVEFTKRDFESAAVIRKTVEAKAPAQVHESTHVYVRGVGEVERKQFEAPGKGPKRLTVETRLAN